MSIPRLKFRSKRGIIIAGCVSMTVVEKIDFILQKRNMSRRQLAKEAGIPASSLQSAMERGKNISLDMLTKIAIALNVSLSDLLPSTEETAFQDWNTVSDAFLRKAREIIQANSDLQEMDAASEEVHKLFEQSSLKGKEYLLLNHFGKLNENGRDVAIERVKELTFIPAYQKQSSESEDTQNIDAQPSDTPSDK